MFEDEQLSPISDDKAICLVISGRKKVSLHCYELQFVTGSSFFVSSRYIEDFDEAMIDIGESFSSERLEELMRASFAYACECDAVSYLERAEQCRFKLETKLRKKGYSKEIISVVLDALEQANLLSDARFAEAWLRSRSICHAEGRTKLMAELLSRGIPREIAVSAIDEFFSNTSEDEVFERAVEKCRRLGYSPEKTAKKLAASGFSHKQINRLNGSH